MRRWISYLLAAVIMAVAIQPALAVDKKKKEEPKKSTIENKKKQAEKTKKISDNTAKGSSKKFDKFVDKNKNGIDDRRENLRTKQVAKDQQNVKTTDKKKIESDKAKKEATKKDSTKAPAKKKK